MNTIDLIIDIFQGFRMAPLAIDQFDTIGVHILRQKLQVFVDANLPIKFSIMGFPMKSPNTRDKVLGVVPDMAEQATLDNFKDFDTAIKAVYSPGVHIAIISDGLAFSDVMDVEDRVVHQYQEISMDMSKDGPVQWYNMTDFYDKKLSLAVIRDKLISQFGITNQELERRILLDADVNMLYKGMIRFMNLDLAIRDYTSNTQQQKAAKILAREMMFRNEAYSKLVQTEFADHIRLSMHPSINNGVKFSFQLIRSPKAWTSAWHCALFINSDKQLETVHRKDAIAAGYDLIYRNNQPYAFTA